jgi:hypothetical protein
MDTWASQRTQQVSHTTGDNSLETTMLATFRQVFHHGKMSSD